MRAYHKKSAAGTEETSLFRKNASGLGAVAADFDATTLECKAINLGDSKSRYVLLDFWATRCGPCFGEIHNLQALCDNFGKDERFAILCLGVNEKIDEPRNFQENRKVPWTPGVSGKRNPGAGPQHIRRRGDSGLGLRRPRRQDRRPGNAGR